MKGIVFAGDSKIEYLDFPDPTPGPDEVVLEIKASGMCGSDLKFYRSPRGELCQTLDKEVGRAHLVERVKCSLSGQPAIHPLAYQRCLALRWLPPHSEILLCRRPQG